VVVALEGREVPDPAAADVAADQRG
jgi:hypothetical protein